MNILFFISLSAALFLIVADYISTVKCLDHGGFEGNFINRYLFSKLGMPLTTFLEAVAVLILAAAAFTYDPAIGAGYCLGIAGLEAYMTVRNIRKLRAKLNQN